MAAPVAVSDRSADADVPSTMSDGIAQSFDVLAWDSDAFGFGVARIRDSVRSAQAFSAVLGGLRERHIRLAYFSCPWTDAAARTVAVEHGGRLVDRKVTYAAACSDIVTGAPAAGVTVRQFTGSEPDEALIRLARLSGEYSRFRVDPDVEPRVFEYIFESWIRNSVTAKIADVVYVAQLDDALVGLVTVGRRADRGDIGLLAVDDRARRRGVGRALIEAARGWTVARKLPLAQVVTQGDNAAACALYESCGYEVEHVVAVYHCWL